MKSGIIINSVVHIFAEPTMVPLILEKIYEVRYFIDASNTVF